MVYPIMTQALPTVIGMGVTSRAIDVLFEKKKVKGRIVAGQRRTRTFNGKKYQAANWHTTKSVADKDADYLRKAGHSARVVKLYNARVKRWGYMVYVR